MNLICNLHGNFMVMHNLGVVITGNSTIGKSELSLQLLDRGHQLVADDVIDITLSENQLIGSAPPLTHGYLLIQYLGILDIKKIFGEKALVSKHPIDFFVELRDLKEMPTIDNPLQPIMEMTTIAGNSLPKIVLPISTKENLALMIDMLARNLLLQRQGFDASTTFNQKLQQEINRDNNKS